MTVTNRHTIGYAAANTTILGGITRQAVNTGTEVRGEAVAGAPWVRFRSIVAQKPGGEFTSRAIAACLAACTVLGKDLSTLAAGLSLYFARHARGARIASGSVHSKYTFRDGLWLPRSLAIDHRGDAQLTCAIVATYDGTNAPLIVSHTEALPAAPTEEVFTLGPFRVGGVVMGQMTNLQIDFGLSESLLGADSDLYDTFASIEGVEPAVTMKGTNLVWLDAAAVPLTGKVGTHANTTWYLRKRAAGATYVADATAEHIQFTGAGLAYVTGAASGGQKGPAECTVVMPLDYDGTNSPLVVNTAAAIAAFS